MEDSELLCEKDKVFVVTEFMPSFNEKGAVLTRTQSSLTYLSTFSRVSRIDALEAFDKGRKNQSNLSF